MQIIIIKSLIKRIAAYNRNLHRLQFISLLVQNLVCMLLLSV